MHKHSIRNKLVQKPVLILAVAALPVLGLSAWAVARNSDGDSKAASASIQSGASDTAGSQADGLRQQPAAKAVPAPPASGENPDKQTRTVRLVADSGSAAVNAIQATVQYPADKLSFAGVTDSSDFPLVVATDSSKPGVIRLSRGVTPGHTGVSGKRTVVSLKFTALSGSADTAPITVDAAGSLLVRSADAADILGKGGRLTIEP